MALYTVHAPPLGEKGATDPLQFAFVKDGFCWPALFFALPWLIFRRMWLVLVCWIAVVALLRASGLVLPEGTVATIGMLGGVLFAFEANGLRRWTLERNGWRQVGAVTGRGLLEAEARFFARTDLALVPAAPATEPSGRPPRQPSAEPDIIGLFPAPGGAR